MTLEQLSEEYYNAAIEHEKLINLNRQRLKEAVKNFDNEEEYRLSRLLQVLYSEHRELLETAAHLKHYYKFRKGA